MWPSVTHGDSTGGEGRLRLYSYLNAEHTRTYVAIMRLFTATLLPDLSPNEVAAALKPLEREGRLDIGESDPDTVADRLKRLKDWGNLVQGRRETIASSIAEFVRGAFRYQINKLAVRVQRDVDELLRVPEGAREVSRELLPAIERGLSKLGGTLSQAMVAEQQAPGSASAKRAKEELAEQVTTLFLQHAELAVTVRDFYAYLGQVVTRFHLDPDEISGFRNLLVEYIQMVVEDVLRHTPAIAESLAGLAPARGELLRILGPTERLGIAVERGRGRSETDWRELTDWFADRPGRPSQVTALREATARAIGSLLASVKRATAGGGLLPSRRAELLQLAGWLDSAGPHRSHELYAAAFGLYSARHLLPAPEHDGDDEHTPWRDGPVVEVNVSVRSRGDRGARGRASRILDDPMLQETLLAQAREADRQRAAAVAELSAAAPALAQSNLSPEALEVLCELLTMAMAQRERDTDTGSAADPVHGLRLTINHVPDQVTQIATSGGVLTLHHASVQLGERA